MHRARSAADSARQPARRAAALLAVVVAAAVGASAATGCSDVGDSSAVPGGGDDATGGSVLDATNPADATAETSADAPGDGAADATATTDTGAADSTHGDTGAPATGADSGNGIQETGSPDAGAQDVAPRDAGIQEGSASETGAQDAAAQDTGVRDAGGLADATVDATSGDGGSTDARDGGAADASVPDASPDVREGGGGLHPCTVAGDTSCVQCQYNDTAPKADKTCTPTEAAIVQRDIDHGYSTTAGPSDPGSCYGCLANLGCLDDTQFGDTDHECGDPLATGTASQCEDTLACILDSTCASASVSVCYCGTAGLLTTCQGNPAAGPIDGACAATIAAGLGFPVTDGTDNTAQLTSTTFASGKAVQIFQCAITNGCTACP